MHAWRLPAAAAVALATGSCATAEVDPTPEPPSPGMLAFAGAEGFGGRARAGGREILVTSLADRGSGTLRACLEAGGPRTCRFAVDGTIVTETLLVVDQPHLSVEGQSAPPPGITIRSAAERDGAALVIDTHDVVLRHLRIEAGPRTGATSASRDALHIGENARDVVVDHASLRFGVDENLGVNGCDVTVQWSIIAWGLERAGHHKRRHSKGVLGANPDPECGVSLHHNLLAHNRDRNPDLNFAKIQMVNNVVYNPGSEVGEFRRGDGEAMALNFVGNIVRKGPNSRGRLPAPVNLKPTGAPTFAVYVADNLAPQRARPDLADERVVSEEDRDAIVAQPHPMPPVTTLPSAEVLAAVLAEVGASRPERDAIDRQLIREVRDRAGRIVDDPREVSAAWP